MHCILASRETESMVCVYLSSFLANRYATNAFGFNTCMGKDTRYTFRNSKDMEKFMPNNGC